MLQCNSDSPPASPPTMQQLQLLHPHAQVSQCHAAGMHAHQMPQRLLQVNRTLQQWAAVPLNDPPDLDQLCLLRLLPFQLRNKKHSERQGCGSRNEEASQVAEWCRRGVRMKWPAAASRVWMLPLRDADRGCTDPQAAPPAAAEPASSQSPRLQTCRRRAASLAVDAGGGMTQGTQANGCCSAPSLKQAGEGICCSARATCSRLRSSALTPKEVDGQAERGEGNGSQHNDLLVDAQVLESGEETITRLLYICCTP